MSGIPKDRVPRLANGCRMSTAEGQQDMLMVPEGALRLTGPGPAILSLCDGQRTFEQIVQELAQRFSEDPQRIETEVDAFLQRLRDRGAIEVVDA